LARGCETAEFGFESVSVMEKQGNSNIKCLQIHHDS
jgi:hypothetical protein